MDYKTLSEIATNFRYGKMPDKSKISDSGDYPVWSGYRYVGYYDEKNVNKDEIVVVARGVGGTGDVKICREDCFLTNLSIAFKVNEDINPLYVYYFYQIKNLRYLDSGSAQSQITINDLKNVKIPIPNKNIQDKIVEVLNTIDQKIELNNQINNNLYDIGVSIYNEKIVKNGSDRELKTFFEVITGKKDANASNENGIYPFFTCSKQISRIDEYSFDAPAILLAGNGDFNVKVYKGKFDAYQRTYVLIPNNELYLGYLYFAISENLWDLTSSFRGSVIKFITKGMIENYKIPFIDDENIYEYLNNLVDKIRQNSDENEKLSQLRDTLLPKLMNGEIELDKIEI